MTAGLKSLFSQTRILVSPEDVHRSFVIQLMQGCSHPEFADLLHVYVGEGCCRCSYSRLATSQTQTPVKPLMKSQPWLAPYLVHHPLG